MADMPPQDDPQPPTTTYAMSEAHARDLAALQHLAAWLTREQARLEHEAAYVREAAAHARGGLHGYLARVFGLDAAHEPLNIDLERRIITRPSAPTLPTPPPPAVEE